MDILILECTTISYLGIYKDEKLIYENYLLPTHIMFLQMAEEHGFKSHDIRQEFLSEADEDDIDNYGHFYKNLSTFKDYKTYTA